MSTSLGQVFLPCKTERNVDFGEVIWLKSEEQSTETSGQLSSWRGYGWYLL